MPLVTNYPCGSYPCLRESNQGAGRSGFPTVHGVIFCSQWAVSRAKRTAFVMPATAIRETLRYVTLVFLKRQVDKIATARNSLWEDLEY